MKDGWEISSPPLALLLSHPWPPPISQLPQLSAKHSTAKTAAGWSTLMPKTGLSPVGFAPHQQALAGSRESRDPGILRQPKSRDF